MEKNNKFLIIGAGILVVGFVAGMSLRNIFPGPGHMGMQQSHTVQSHRSYSMHITSPTSNVQPDRELDMVFKIVDDNGKTLKDFAVNHEKLMHVIIVRSDLQNFQHLHPEVNKKNGEFTLPVIFPDNGKYRIFADFVPQDSQTGTDSHHMGVTANQDIQVGNNNKTRLLPVTPDNQTTKAAGDYEVTYTIKKPLEAGKQTNILISVMKDGKPVNNLENYLGARAHGILLRKDTLDFVHLHAMGNEMHHMMDDSNKDNELHFEYNFPESGIYKLFTQFQHEGKVITSEYVFQVD